MKIIITGATGFIGSHVLRYFDNQNNIIYAFGRRNLDDYISAYVLYHKWDIETPFNIDIPEKEIDILIHIAGCMDYRGPKEKILSVNVASLDNLFEITRRYRVKHFIYISSSSVYQSRNGILGENDEIHQKDLMNNYSLSKYMAEQKLIEKLDMRIKLSILRPRAVYGPGDPLLLPTILRNTSMGRLVLFGDGEIKTSLTYIDNLCEAISLVIEKQFSHTEIYNISDVEIITLREIYEIIASRYGLQGLILLPMHILTLLERMNKNRFSYIKDIFENSKILDISKIQSLGYLGNKTFKAFMLE